MDMQATVFAQLGAERRMLATRPGPAALSQRGAAAESAAAQRPPTCEPVRDCCWQQSAVAVLLHPQPARGGPLASLGQAQGQA